MLSQMSNICPNYDDKRYRNVCYSLSKAYSYGSEEKTRNSLAKTVGSACLILSKSNQSLQLLCYDFKVNIGKSIIIVDMDSVALARFDDFHFLINNIF